MTASTIRRVAIRLCTLAAAVGITSCARNEPAVQACTMIGCESGVAVQLATVPAAPYSVELTSLPGGPSTIKECATAEACGRDLFFDGVTADSVSVKVTSPAGSSTTQAKATYTVSRPNGPQCDPSCRQARVMVAVP